MRRNLRWALRLTAFPVAALGPRPSAVQALSEVDPPAVRLVASASLARPVWQPEPVLLEVVSLAGLVRVVRPAEQVRVVRSAVRVLVLLQVAWLVVQALAWPLVGRPALAV